MNIKINKFLAVLLVLSMTISLISISSSARSDVLFSEDFEGGELPSDWEVDSDYTDWGWTVGCGDYSSSTGAASGNHNALVVHRTKTHKAVLYTPEISLPSDCDLVKLSFDLVNRSWSGDVDSLNIYVSVSGGEWELLQEITDPHMEWTGMSFSLPSEVHGEVIFICFEMTDNWGYGIGIDNVSVTAISNAAVFSLTYDANDGSGTTVIETTLETMPLVVADDPFTDPQGMRFMNWNTSPDGLGTIYRPGDDILIEEDTVLYAQWVDASSIIEDFEDGVIPDGWNLEFDNNTYKWTVGVGAYSQSLGTHSGNYNAKLVSQNSTLYTSYLITPAADFSSCVSGSISFWYANVRFSTTYLDFFGVYYRIDGGPWIELFYTEEEHERWVFEEILFPEEMFSDNVEIGFMGINHYGNGIAVDDVEIIGSPLARPSVDMVDVTLPDAAVPENGTDYAEQVSVSLNSAYQDSGLSPVVLIKKEGSVVTEAVEGGLYTVSVFIPESDDYCAVVLHDPAWAFYVASTGYACDFDSEYSLDGWTFVDNDGDDKKWYLATFTATSTFCHSLPHALFSDSGRSGSRTPDNWAIMPPIQIPADALLSFWVAPYHSFWPGDKVGVYIGDTPDLAGMQLLCDYLTERELRQYELDLGEYAGSIKYIAFRHYESTDIYACGIDDVVLISHVHGNYTYTVEGDVIYALCGNEGCPITDGYSLEMIAPDPEEEVFEASTYDYNESAFPEVTFTYKGISGTVYAESETAPTEPGYYSVTMSVGNDASLTHEYVIGLYSSHLGFLAHGIVSSDVSSAFAGETVTLTAEANDGYVLEGFNVEYDGTDHFISGPTFQMPWYPVYVSAVFLPETMPSFESHSLLLGGQIGVMFKMDLSMLSYSELENSYMVFSVNGEETTVDFFGAEFVDDGMYRFTCFVNSLQMAEDIEATFYFDCGGYIFDVSDTFAVEDYIEYVVENSDDFDETTVALVCALADYGHYAQIYLSEVNSIPEGKYAPMNTFYTTSFDMGIVNALVSEYFMLCDFGETGVGNAEMRLSLDAETALSVRVSVPSGMIFEASSEFNGNYFEAKPSSGGYYVITITGITALQFADTVTIYGEADGEPIGIDTSVLAYLNAAIRDFNDNDDCLNLISALSYYYIRASEFALAH